jgi:hypothetical protein
MEDSVLRFCFRDFPIWIWSVYGKRCCYYHLRL